MSTTTAPIRTSIPIIPSRAATVPGTGTGTEPVAAHEHGWATLSRHATSEGFVVYVSCTVCGVHRVELTPFAALIATPLTSPIARDSVQACPTS